MRRLLTEFANRAQRVDIRAELDAAAVQLLAAFDDVGVAALLLKGPAVARVLYAPGEERIYSDIDILVDPAALEFARVILRERGYTCVREEFGVEDVGGGLHAEPWVAGIVTIDLHWRLPGAEAPAEVTWKALYAPHQRIVIGGNPVATPSQAGLALHIAIHAAQHGGKHGVGARDLLLALERWPHEVWNQASALAREVDATDALVAGLQLAPGGRELARRLALPEFSQMTWTPFDKWPRGTFHVTAFAKAGSLSERAVLVRRALLPPSKWILLEYPWARRWRPLQIAAYIMHVVRAPLWGSRALRFRRRQAKSSARSGGAS